MDRWQCIMTYLNTMGRWWNDFVKNLIMSFSPIEAKVQFRDRRPNADLLVTMWPDDTDGFHVQNEMNQVGARMKQILGEVHKKE